MQVQSLSQEDPLEEGTATHSNILAWRIPWTEKPGRLWSTGSQRVKHNWSNLASTHTHKTLIKEIEYDSKKWKDIPCSERINIVKTAILPQAIYRQCNPYQITQDIFTELEQIILKFTWNHKRPRIVKAILKKRTKLEDITIPDLRRYHKAIVIKTTRYWHKNRCMDHWNRI